MSDVLGPPQLMSLGIAYELVAALWMLAFIDAVKYTTIAGAISKHERDRTPPRARGVAMRIPHAESQRGVTRGVARGGSAWRQRVRGGVVRGGIVC